jgi:hypothetical protein
MLTEEFSSWIGGIDSSTKGEAAKNRGAWLQLYDGGEYQIDRIGRGSIQLPNFSASVLTATTPSALSKHMKDLPEDGLIQRFLPIIMGPPNLDAQGDASVAEAAWAELLRALYDRPQKTYDFSPEASSLFLQEEKKLRQTAMAMDDVSPALAAHIGKQGDMIARIALTFHVIDDPDNLYLPASTLKMAIRLMEQIRKHSVSLYLDVLGRSDVMQLARALANSLAAAKADLSVIARNWMTQHCKAFEKASDRDRKGAVQLLEDMDWLFDAEIGTYGGWPKGFKVNPEIFRLYSKQGELHRNRREAVRGLIVESAAANVTD